MKAIVVVLVVALICSWAAPGPVAAARVGAMTGGEVPVRDQVVSPDVIGVVAVIGAYAILWGAFAIALRVKRLVD